jgi:serpin B
MVPTDPPTQETDPTQSSEEAPTAAPQSGVAHSAKERSPAPNISLTELENLSAGNSAFAVDLYQSIREGDGNLFFSPYSISLALAMTYGGARGQTAQQMAEVLHFSLPDEQVHAGFNALDLELGSRNNEGDEMMPGFKLNIANSAWAQYDRPFEQDYLDLLAENYGAGLYLTDFSQDPEGSRLAINEWVSEETEEKIEDLIPPGAIDALTRLVLANAIYFNAAWQTVFDANLTEEAPFYLLDGSQINVPMMAHSSATHLGYVRGDGYQAVELPYNGGQLSMVLLVPEADSFADFEANLTTEQLAQILGSLKYQQVEFRMPKFTFESDLGLASTLKQLGMQDAFTPEAADFSGIDGTREMVIKDVIHKAFVDVNEEGTEAAAATAVIIGLTSMVNTEVQMTVDHPFIFLIHDKPTGTILFLGRVLDPTQ